VTKHRTKQRNRRPEDPNELLRTESGQRHTSGIPSQGLSENPLDHGPSGRMERRLPIIVVVRLGQAESGGTDREERTFTDNISPHGARIFSKRAWQRGEMVRVTPLNQDAVFGNVVYCQRPPDDRYSIGVKFQGRPVTWSALQRYNGLLS
jgi:hypothetical protein